MKMNIPFGNGRTCNAKISHNYVKQYILFNCGTFVYDGFICNYYHYNYFDLNKIVSELNCIWFFVKLVSE